MCVRVCCLGTLVYTCVSVRVCCLGTLVYTCVCSCVLSRYVGIDVVYIRMVYVCVFVCVV